MMFLNSSIFVISLICVITRQEFVSSQVTINITQLAHEIFDSTNANNVPPWFSPAKMTEYTKFMLCVDAYQKMLGTRLVDEHYITDNGTTKLPQFKIVNQDVINPIREYGKPKKIKVIHCPLHKVQFSSLNYNYGMEFYISGSRPQLCVYVFVPLTIDTNTMFLEVTAKVCEIMVHVRYNRVELDEEFSTVHTKFGLDLMKWTNVECLDNEKRFIICLTVLEKLSRTHLYLYKIKFENYRLLPIFDIVHKNLNLINGIIENLEVLHCPLNEIRFPQSLKVGVIPPFYLAKSFHHDCVYKMAPNDANNLTDLRLKAEICDIFGTVNKYNNTYLEEDLIARLTISKDPSFNVLSWDEVNRMKQIVRYHMCSNVLQRIHMKYFYIPRPNTLVYTDYLFPTIDSYNLKLDHLGMENKPITVFECPMYMFTEDHLARNSFYLAKSPRIGCVYSLTGGNYSGEWLLTIDKLICGIYSSRHMLLLDNKNYIKTI